MNSTYKLIINFLKTVRFAEYKEGEWGFVQTMDGNQAVIVITDEKYSRRQFQLHTIKKGWFRDKQEVLTLDANEVSVLDWQCLDDVLCMAIEKATAV